MSATHDRYTILVVLNLGGVLVRRYWSAYSFLELARFSRGQKIQLVMRCRAIMFRRHWVLQVVSFSLIAAFLLLPWLRPKLQIGAAECLGVILFVIALNQLELYWLRDLIRTELPGYCGQCGYDLSGYTSGVCPECGTAVSESPKEPPPQKNLLILRWFMGGGEIMLNIFTVLLIIALIVIALYAVRRLIFVR